MPSSRTSQYSAEEGKKSQGSKILLPPISSFFLWAQPSDLDHPLKQYINSFGNCHCLNCHITESLVSPGLSRKVKLIDDHITSQIFSINALWVVGCTLHREEFSSAFSQIIIIFILHYHYFLLGA